MPVDAPVRLVYILRDLILHALSKLSVKCLDRFEVYQRFHPCPRLGQGGPNDANYALVHFGKQAASPLKSDPRRARLLGYT